jgi:predicted DNA-binding transcriptional regulator YafY
MSRAQRLLDLLQILRSHRYPVSGTVLAGQLGVSLRTLYRDIAVLQCQGAHIEGEAGMGYVLRPGFMLPPLMFSEDEIQALVLGSRWVAGRADAQLARAAGSALAKIAAVLPAQLRDEADASSLFVAPSDQAADSADVALIRQAIRRERKLRIEYRDERAAQTARVIWPFALGFFDRVRIVAAWCELRDGFRHFRTDRIVALDAPGERYPRRRHALMATWRETVLSGCPEYRQE